MTDTVDYCEAVRELADKAIVERQAALAGAGLRTTVDIERWSQTGSENSELRIAFWREDAFVDILEDFIVQDGTPVASLSEFKLWLDHGIDVIVEENRRGEP